MATMADAAPQQEPHRLGAVVLWVVGGVISAALAAAVWVWASFELMLWSWRPVTVDRPGPLAVPHPYTVLAVVWTAAAAAELLAAIFCVRWPRAGAAVVVCAVLAGFAAIATVALADRHLLTVWPLVVAWFVPAVPLGVGVISARKATFSDPQA